MESADGGDSDDGKERMELLARLGIDPFSKGQFSQKDHGHIGGMVAGRLGSNKYVVDYAVDARSKCRHPCCRASIHQGMCRIGKIPPALRTGHAIRTQWYHPECIFKTFLRMTKSTKTIDSPEDLAGFEQLRPEDQMVIKQCINEEYLRSFDPNISSAESLYVSDEGEKNRSLESMDANEVAAKIAGLGAAFQKTAQQFVECGVDGKYVLAQSPEDFDQILFDFGIDDNATGRQKRRRICFELGVG